MMCMQLIFCVKAATPLHLSVDMIFQSLCFSSRNPISNVLVITCKFYGLFHRYEISVSQMTMNNNYICSNPFLLTHPFFVHDLSLCFSWSERWTDNNSSNEELKDMLPFCFILPFINWIYLDYFFFKSSFSRG